MKKQIFILLLALALTSCGAAPKGGNQMLKSVKPVVHSIEKRIYRIQTTTEVNVQHIMNNMPIPEPEPPWVGTIPTSAEAVGIATSEYTAMFLQGASKFLFSTDTYQFLFDLDKNVYLFVDGHVYKYVANDFYALSYILPFNWIDLDEKIVVYGTLVKDLLHPLEDGTASYRDRVICYDENFRITQVDDTQFLYEEVEVPTYSQYETCEYSFLLKTVGYQE